MMIDKHWLSIRFCRQSLLAIILGCFFNSMAYALELAGDVDWHKPDYIAKAFAEIALKNEYRTTQKRLLKWQSPIRYGFQYHDLPHNEMIENLYNMHMQHLADITGHNIQRNDKNPNLTIHITRDKDYGSVITRYTPSKVKDIDRQSHCMGNFNTVASAIVEAQIVLPVDHLFSRGLLVACVVEESTQVMGLPNDSNWVNPSIANDASKIELLTGLDYLMLKILYDKKLKAGMSYQQSQPIIKDIIKRLEVNGTIRNSQHLVNQAGLNHYLK